MRTDASCVWSLWSGTRPSHPLAVRADNARARSSVGGSVVVRTTPPGPTSRLEARPELSGPVHGLSVMSTGDTTGTQRPGSWSLSLESTRDSTDAPRRGSWSLRLSTNLVD